MYRTIYDPACGCLFMQHFGPFVGAEIQQAILEAFKQVPKDLRSGCCRIFVDLRDVTHATMDDSDRAKLTHTLRALAGLINVPASGSKSLLETIKVVRVMNPDNPCTPILNQRLEAQLHSFSAASAVDGIIEGFAYLGLPTDYQVQYPDAPTVHGIKPTEIR